MTRPLVILIAAIAMSGLPARAAAQAAAVAETLAEIRIHGNQVSTAEEVIALAGIAVGAPFTATTVQEVDRRLRATGRFVDVDVRKRYASISDLTKVALVIVVNEGPVRVEFEQLVDEQVTRVVRRRWYHELMYLPILDGEDGYGLTYGLTTSMAGVLGDSSRLSVPLSWGGTKRAAVELEKNLDGGPFTRVEIGAAVQRQTNPAFDVEDRRRRTWFRAERALGSFRLGGTAAFDRVSFADVDEDLVTTGVDVAFDTRLDPGYPRNAVWLSAAVERVHFGAGHVLYRSRLDGRGYLGLVGKTVLAVRVAREGANGAQPRHLQPLLGGWSSLRGFEAGRFHGDIVALASAEYFVPLTSPMNVGQLGVSVFADAGVAYAHGLRFGDQVRRTGVGGSLWFTATGFRLSLSVAHGRGGATRVNFGGGFTF